MRLFLEVNRAGHCADRSGDTSVRAEDASEKHFAAVTSSKSFTVSSCQKWQPRSTKGQKYSHIAVRRAHTNQREWAQTPTFYAHLITRNKFILGKHCCSLTVVLKGEFILLYDAPGISRCKVSLLDFMRCNIFNP